MINYDEINQNVENISTTSAEVYRAVEKRASSDIFAPKHFSTAEKIAYLYLGTMGQDLYYSDHTKIRIPAAIRDDAATADAFEMGMKQMYVKTIMTKAKQVVYKIAEQMEKNREAKINFEAENLTNTEVMAVLHLAQLNGFNVAEWDKLDHSFCDVHTDWVCLFYPGTKIKHENVIEDVLNECSRIDLIPASVRNSLRLTDNDVLSDLQTSYNL